MTWKQYHDELKREIYTEVDARLSAYRPNLAQATGNLSPTQYPTPTGNAPGGYPPSAHTHPWSDITSTPTTLAGYGITDAQPLDSDLTAIAGLSTTSYGRGFLTQADAAAARGYIGAGTGSGTVTSVNITAPAAGITASGGPIISAGAITLALANDLAALEGLSSTGLAARTAADAWAQRTITGTSNRVSVTNGNGVSGNPTIDIDAAYVGQASITTLGTIATGVWHGTLIGVLYGGTGADLSATGPGFLKQATSGANVTVATLVAGDIPDLSATYQPLDADLTAIAALGSTGLAVRTAANTWAQRTITGTANRISVTNGNGVSGNPTLDIDAAYVGQTSITTLGTISTGTWQGTKIGLAYGGTNADLSATGGANQIVRQNSAGGVLTVSVLAAGDIPSLDSAKITTGEIPRSPLTTRGDLLTQNPNGTHTRLAIGAAARYLRSDGTDPSWHTLDAADLAYSGLTTGQVLRATGTTTAAFGALDLANSSAVTGILPAANGGTGVNNGSNNLTVPASGTAALLGAANVFTALQTVTLTTDQLLLRSASGKGTGFFSGNDGTTGHGDAILISANATTSNGTTWNRIDTSGIAWQLAYGESAADLLVVRRAAAGSNPITWTNLLTLSSAGALTAASDVKASGGLNVGSASGAGSGDIKAAGSATISTGINVGTATSAAAGEVRASSGFILSTTRGTLSAAGPMFYRDAALGGTLQGFAGSTADSSIITPGGNRLFENPTGTNTVLFLGSAAGNVGIGGTSFGGAALALFIANGTAPTSNPSGGGILFAAAGAGKWRGSSGTVTTFGPAEPHCPVCGRDFVLEWENPSLGHLLICMWCATEGMRNGVIRRHAA